MLGFLKKIFGGKDKNAKLDFADSLEEIDMDLDVSFNSNDDTFEDKDYKYKDAMKDAKSSYTKIKK